MLNRLSNEQFREAVVLFMRELNISQQDTVKRVWKLSKNYDNKDSKFMLKNILYDVFWQIPEAVDDGFNHYLTEKVSEYHHLWEYHKVNCNSSRDCKVCKEQIKIIKYLEE